MDYFYNANILMNSVIHLFWEVFTCHFMGRRGRMIVGFTTTYAISV
jgi:hypothetical protein